MGPNGAKREGLGRANWVRIGEFFADQLFVGLDGFEGFGEMGGAASEAGEGGDEAGKEFGLAVEDLQSAIGVKLEHDVDEVVGGESEGVLLRALESSGAGA